MNIMTMDNGLKQMVINLIPYALCIQTFKSGLFRSEKLRLMCLSLSYAEELQTAQ